jgi:amidase
MAPASVTTAFGATWQEVAANIQAYRDESIAGVQPPIPDVPVSLPRNVTGIPKQLLSPREVSLTECPPEKLVASLANSQVSCTEVTNAFLRRAGLAQKLVS